MAPKIQRSVGFVNVVASGLVYSVAVQELQVSYHKGFI